MNSAAGVRYGECLCLTRGSAFYFSHHLPQIELGDDKCFYSACEFADLVFGEGPRCDQPQLADAQSPFTSSFDGALRDPRSNPVGNDDHICIVELFFVEPGAEINMASTTRPAFSIKPFSITIFSTSASICAASPCVSRRWRNRISCR